MNQHLKELASIRERRRIVHMDILKHILLIASTGFGILVAFRSTQHSLDSWARLVYPTSLSLLALGILFCVVGLFGELRGLVGYQNKMAEEITRAKITGTKPGRVGSSYPTFFLVCEIIGYIAMILAVFLLVLYSFLVA